MRSHIMDAGENTNEIPCHIRYPWCIPWGQAHAGCIFPSSLQLDPLPWGYPLPWTTQRCTCRLCTKESHWNHEWCQRSHYSSPRKLWSGSWSDGPGVWAIPIRYFCTRKEYSWPMDMCIPHIICLLWTMAMYSFQAIHISQQQKQKMAWFSVIQEVPLYQKAVIHAAMAFSMNVALLYMMHLIRSSWRSDSDPIIQKQC